MDPIKTFIGRVAGVASSSVAQAIQSLTSMVVLMLAAQLLGLEALGLFSILYGALILAAAITSGFVGDTLMVLDRHDPQIQAGLRFWFVTLSLTLGITAALLSWLGTELGWFGAVLYGLVAIAYVAEELIRRSHMAVLSFGKLILVDLVVLGTTTIVLVAFGAFGRLSIEVFMAAILIGQCAGTLYGWHMLPSSEKVSPKRPARIRPVASFGIWRSALQSLRPAQLTAMRVFVTAAIGLVSAGQMEAARLYAAPAMLLVTGTCSYLFATLARQRDATPRQQLRNTDAVVSKLFVATIFCAVVGILLLPWGGPLLTGIVPSGIAVTGWLAYACAVAISTPYGLLAAVREEARPVFVIRFFDSILSLILVTIVLVITSDFELVPWAAAAGALAGGLFIRQWVLRGTSTHDSAHLSVAS